MDKLNKTTIMLLIVLFGYNVKLSFDVSESKHDIDRLIRKSRLTNLSVENLNTYSSGINKIMWNLSEYLSFNKHISEYEKLTGETYSSYSIDTGEILFSDGYAFPIVDISDRIDLLKKAKEKR